MGIFDSLFGIKDAKNAAQNAANASRTEANSAYSDIAGSLTPYTTSGQQARTTLSNLTGLNGLGAQNEAYNNFQFSPDYQVRFDQGGTALQKLLAGTRGLNSGAAMKGAMQFGADLGAQGYNDYYSKVAGLDQTGLQALGLQANARQGMANNIINANTSEGNAVANASLVGGSMLMGGLTGLANLAGMYSPQISRWMGGNNGSISGSMGR